MHAAQDEDGWTPLIAATCYNHEDVVQVTSPRTARALVPLTLLQELLEAGADPNICDKMGLRPMHYAGACRRAKAA